MSERGLFWEILRGTQGIFLMLLGSVPWECSGKVSGVRDPIGYTQGKCPYFFYCLQF